MRRMNWFLSNGKLTYVFLVRRLAQSVKVMIAIAIFLTYSLQFYVPFEIIWKGTKHRFTSRPVLFEYLLRVSLVVCTGKCPLVSLVVVKYSVKTPTEATRIFFLSPSVLYVIEATNEPPGTTYSIQ